MEGIEQTAGRDSRGRFQPGQSGNPAGKPPGTKNRATLLQDALRDGEVAAALRVIIDKAVAGNVAAARFVLDGIAPKPRGRAIDLGLPEDAPIAEAHRALLRHLFAGEVTADEALQIQRAIVQAPVAESKAVIARTAAAPAPAPSAPRPGRRRPAAPPEFDLNLQARGASGPTRPTAKAPSLKAALLGTTALGALGSAAVPAPG